ncbi:MAG: hypothetical protein AMXMBFR82_26390 [Candidatus Hydrogenedentota bacterium]
MDIKLLNGAVIAVLGVLVILTPLVKEMSERDTRLNLIAGGVLVMGGALLLALYIRERRQSPPSKDG